MEMGIKKPESPVSTALKGAAIGGTIAGAAKIGHGIAKSKAVDSFYKKAVEEQNALIESFKNSGKTVDQYMKSKRNFIYGTKSYGKFSNMLMQCLGKPKMDGSDTEKLLHKIQDTFNEYSFSSKREINSKLKQMEHILKKDKVSKPIAIKDTVVQIGEKVGEKAETLKKYLGDAFKEKGFKNKLTGAKDAVLKFVNETPSLKKSGKFALIGAIATAAVAGGAKLISNHVQSKKENTEVFDAELLDNDTIIDAIDGEIIEGADTKALVPIYTEE